MHNCTADVDRRDQGDRQRRKMTAPGDANSLVVQNLRPGTRYKFRVAAENRHGISPESQAVTTRMLEEGLCLPPIYIVACTVASRLITWLQTVYVSFAAPSSPPRNVQLTPKSSTQLEITWEAPTLVDWNSEHLSYKVGYKYGRLGDIRK